MTRGIEARCTHCGRDQKIELRNIAYSHARRLAGLLDGSSGLYPATIHPAIGKCLLCGGPFKAKTFGYSEDAVAS